jgi:hypothetical protein
VYLITNADAIAKYARDDLSVQLYTNNQLGPPVGIDAGNPMKIMVWYADFRTVVFLDRNMTELGRLDLQAAGFPNVRTIAATPDGNLWTYDESAFKVRKLAPDGTVLLESPDLSVFTRQRLYITCIRDDGNQVYLSNPAEGLMILDAYAQSCRTRMMKKLGDFQIIGNLLYTITGNSLHIEDLKAFTATDIALPGPFSSGLRWLGFHRLMVQYEGKLSVLSF